MAFGPIKWGLGDVMAEELHPPPSGLPANPHPPAPRRRLQIRSLRRVLSSADTTYLVAAGLGALILGVLGAILGILHSDVPGFFFGASAGMMLGLLFTPLTGALLSAFSGTVIGGLAWVFDGPGKGAWRCGAVCAALLGLFGLAVVIASALGGAGAAPALAVLLAGVASGGFGGAALGAFLGWLGGPIFRGLLEELEERSA